MHVHVANLWGCSCRDMRAQKSKDDTQATQTHINTCMHAVNLSGGHYSLTPVAIVELPSGTDVNCRDFCLVGIGGGKSLLCLQAPSRAAPRPPRPRPPRPRPGPLPRRPRPLPLPRPLPALALEEHCGLPSGCSSILQPPPCGFLAALTPLCHAPLAVMATALTAPHAPSGAAPETTWSEPANWGRASWLCVQHDVARVSTALGSHTAQNSMTRLRIAEKDHRRVYTAHVQHVIVCLALSCRESQETAHTKVKRPRSRGSIGGVWHESGCIGLYPHLADSSSTVRW